MSEKHKEWRQNYLLIDPNGIEYKPELLYHFCKEYDLPLSTLSARKHGETVKKGKAKGWTVYRI